LTALYRKIRYLKQAHHFYSTTAAVKTKQADLNVDLKESVRRKLQNRK